MSLRIPLTPDQTLQTEFHEIERRLRKLERATGVNGSTTVIRVSGTPSGAQLSLANILERLTTLEQAVDLINNSSSSTPSVYAVVGSSANQGIVPSPGIASPPTGTAQHVLTEDNYWGFPFRGLVQVTTPGNQTGTGTDLVNVEGHLSVNADLSARDIEARTVRTLDGVSIEGDSYQLRSDLRGLVQPATDGTQTDPPYDVLDVNAALHTQEIQAANVNCYGLYVTGDVEYSDGFYDDLRIEPVARLTGANAPAFEQYADDSGLGDTGTSRGVYLYSFDDAPGGSEKEVHFTMQMPHAWRLGTPISMHVHWIGAVNDTTAAPRWGLEYAWKDIGQTFGQTLTVYSTGQNFDASGSPDANVTAGKHYISEFAPLTPGTSADGVSSILIGRLFRDSANAADTYNAVGAQCGLLYIDAHYQIDSPGSSDEYVK